MTQDKLIELSPTEEKYRPIAESIESIANLFIGALANETETKGTKFDAVHLAFTHSMMAAEDMKVCLELSVPELKDEMTSDVAKLVTMIADTVMDSPYSDGVAVCALFKVAAEYLSNIMGAVIDGPLDSLTPENEEATE